MQSKTDEIYMRLKEELLRLRFRRDEIINEKKLAEQYDVSKTPVREALGMLVQEGYLERYAVVGDRRKTKLLCTGKADPIIRRGRAVQNAFFKRLLDHVEPADQEVFFRTMELIGKNLDEIIKENA